MKSILVDTSGDFISFTIIENNSLVGTFSVKNNKRMNESLLPHLDFFLNSIKTDISDINNFNIVVGPGSFTGLRIGISTMLGLTSGIGKKLYGITSLDAAALCLKDKKFSVACKLRLKEYAVRDYDFSLNKHSEYYYSVENKLPEDTFIINGKNPAALTLNLSLAIMNEYFGSFLINWLPFYMQKSEAEIQFDKKSKI
jgi:tRNA threonylcarbamoyl adenosine modification protein YeaZ